MATNNTLTLINTVTVGAGGAANITFNSIPSTYTDLLVQWSGRTSKSETGDNTVISFNGSTADFTGRYLEGSGSGSGGAGSFARFVGVDSASTGTSNTFSNNMVYIPNYAGSNNKSFSADSGQENNTTQAQLTMNAGLWSQSAAITSVTLTPSVGSYVQYSTAYLYGVKSVATSAKATGGNITQDDTYFYHTFLSSGVFTPTQSLTADYLVVAGGGGTAGDRSGGGGAGGLRCTVGATGGGGSLESPLSLTASAYTITVGAGGSSGSGGSASSIAGSGITTVSTVGGGYGGFLTNNGGNGGSGGGAGGQSTPAGGTGTANQGFAGGSGAEVAAGGGGGAGTIGTNGSAPAQGAGNGGNGVTTSISGTSTTYGGGGGGYGGANPGAGGTGGGGNGSIGNTGAVNTNGIANTGGGSGGGHGAMTGSGGSGIVIVRYAK